MPDPPRPRRGLRTRCWRKRSTGRYCRSCAPQSPHCSERVPKRHPRSHSSASPPYAQLLARTVSERFDSTWGLSETGAAGPTGNPYGDAAGHSCIAIAGPVSRAITLETGRSDRVENMVAFAKAALELLAAELG